MAHLVLPSHWRAVIVSDTRKPPRDDPVAPQEGSKSAPFDPLFGRLFLVALFLAEYLCLKLKIESVGQHIEKLFHGSLCNGTQILLFYPSMMVVRSSAGTFSAERLICR